MVVADQSRAIADVVFVIEGTANLSPYIENLKANYILPTLEYFNGGPPDDKDCGCDFNSTMYTLVVFMASDHAPELAATCHTPTPSTHKFLNMLDRVLFIGGGGESCSHIAEGLSTALQVFDDFSTIRDSGVTTQKYCILVCNSPPYPLPALENSNYSGLVTEQLASLMIEKQIHFSIFSPRKIPALLKLYDKATGDLSNALTKNYAKDRRHLVLLKGYQLQERPLSPPPMETKSSGSPLPVQPRSPATVGILPPSSQPPVSQVMVTPGQVQSGMVYTQSGLVPPNQAMSSRPGVPTPPNSHLATSLNQPNPPNVTITNKGPQAVSSDLARPGRGQSPVQMGGPRMNWNQGGGAAPSPPISTTPPTTVSLLASQLAMAPVKVSSAAQQNNPQPNSSLSGLVSQPPNTIGQQGMVSQGNPGIRPGMSPVQMRVATPPQQQSLPQPGQVQQGGPGQSPNHGQNQMVPNSMVQGPLSVQLGQIPFSQGGPQGGQAPTGPPGQPAQGNSMMQPQGMPGKVMQPNAPMQNPQGVPMGSGPNQGMMNPGMSPIGGMVSPQMGGMLNPLPGMVKDKQLIWQGNLEFQEKPGPGPAITRVTHLLSCSVLANVINGEVEVSGNNWPPVLCVQPVPKTLMMSANLFNSLKTTSRHVIFQFVQENERYGKLVKLMSNGFIGVIQFPGQNDIRIMLLVFSPEKRLFSGVIANDQEGFYNAMRQMYDTHRKQQVAKQQKLMLHTSQGPQVYNQNTISNYNQLQQLSGGTVQPQGNLSMPVTGATNPQGLLMSQNPGMGGNGSQQLGPPGGRPPPSTASPGVQGPMGGPQGVQPGPPNQQAPPQQQPQQGGAPGQPPQQPGAPPGPSGALTQQASRLSQLEAERQQNLLKIQQLQQTLEAAQQKELQYKQQAQEHVVVPHHQLSQHLQQQQQQQQQQHHQAMLERQRIQMQQARLMQLQQQQQQQQQVSSGGTNPQLRHLLQQQVGLQQMRQPPQQLMYQSQQQPGMVPSQGQGVSIRGQMVGQPQQQQQQPGQPPWDDASLSSVLELMQ